MAVDKTEAVCWVLHRRPYRQSSVILELLSADGEHLAVVARAARALRRRSSPPPALCSRLRLWYRKGRGNTDLYSLTGSETEAVYLLTGKALGYALRANELIVRGTKRLDINPALPGLYGELMQALNGPQMQAEHWRAAYAAFQLGLLAALGYSLDLRRDSRGRPLRAEKNYRLHSDRGLEMAADGWKGEVLQAVASGNLSAAESLTAAEDIAQKTLPLITRHSLY